MPAHLPRRLTCFVRGKATAVDVKLAMDSIALKRQELAEREKYVHLATHVALERLVHVHA
jgi:hypothetical protein